MQNELKFRSELRVADLAAIRDILRSAGFFYEHEIDIGVELAETNLSKGEEASGYIFLIAENTAGPVAFTCYGKTPCTADSFDLYWIAVHKSMRGGGLGKTIMQKVSDAVRRMGGRKLWIETSSRPLYEPTRMFYLKNGCELVAELPDFYGEGDNKCIFLKRL
ncbi:MAG: GNAT family N-acetyltransferase [Candidatus Neomarinimicrobiota bacterium]|jgi:GNAT superfamily N-acetyltransferase|nr:GNAT family N-acetyltransferase [Candidatus Neomarinimicrobiota bacterium]MDD3965600.1 GNAT family N-acetyltransferase [Candidatus Neomarinimicrobiota bacterium]MDX9779418.1 GNAT family N-acetyltransferase [bacterium]